MIILRFVVPFVAATMVLTGAEPAGKAAADGFDSNQTPSPVAVSPASGVRGRVAPSRDAATFTVAAAIYANFSGPGEPVRGAGLGGWRSGRDEVRYRNRSRGPRRRRVTLRPARLPVKGALPPRYVRIPMKTSRLVRCLFLPLLASALASLCPAGVEGKWAAEFETQVGVQMYVFEFETTHGTRLEGLARWERMEQKGETLLKELKLDGENLSFVETISLPDLELRVTYAGKVAGDELRLTRQVGEFATEQLVAKRIAAAGGGGAAVLPPGSNPDRKLASGPFAPTWESLAEHYRAPEWFRDAKFGIWAHWSAQCVPEEGDWYARQMYLQGHRHHAHAVKTYGHPSEVGFMEIEHRWKAEKWEPEKLMDLYVRAGAKYFVALANHHDNFDAYDSKHHAWNSVNVGPKKDIVGTWAKIARARGLRFGVSNHSAHAWHWYQPAYGYDPEGPKAGVRYDAFRLKKEDGKGKWWEGLDPLDLYTGPNMVMPDGITTIQEANAWHDRHDRRWTERPPEMNPKFTDTWFLRTQDLVDKYRPDLLYFDNFALPLGQAGLDIAAHYYNASRQWHDGKPEAVINIKGVSPERRGAVIDDIERGVAEGIRPAPWQTDTCIGAWHYERSIYTRNRYKTVGQVVRMLTDIVSKNGNLLLSIPVRGDGTIDDLEVAFLEGMARWMDANGEAIHGTRPWAIYGEGPSVDEQPEAGHFGGARDVRSKPYTSADVRFTTKDDALYAILLAWPEDKKALIKAVATRSAHSGGKQIKDVVLLGHPGKLAWSQDEVGLHVQFPDAAPGEHAYVLKITGVTDL